MKANGYLRLWTQNRDRQIAKGSVTIEGREDTIHVISVNHELLRPAEHFVSGTWWTWDKFQHTPITVTKPIDKSTPVLYELMRDKEVIDEWELEFWIPHPVREGLEQCIYKISLKWVAISGIQMEMLPGDVEFPIVEHVTFDYHWIEFCWEDGGISCDIEWDSQP